MPYAMPYAAMPNDCVCGNLCVWLQEEGTMCN